MLSCDHEVTLAVSGDPISFSLPLSPWSSSSFPPGLNFSVGLASGVCCQLFSDRGLGMQEQEGSRGGSEGWRGGEE